VESANELLYKISLPDQEVATLLVTGSDKELDLAKPQVVLCFIEQST
jgi:hypothetical protein